MMISDYDHVQVNYDMHNLRDENVQIHFDLVVSEQTMIKLQLLNADYKRRKFFSIMRRYQSPIVAEAHSLIFHEHFIIFNVRSFSIDEIEQHRASNENASWW